MELSGVFADEQGRLFEPVRDELRGNALRPQRVLPAAPRDGRLQVRVQDGLQRHRACVHGRVCRLLRQRGPVRQGRARPAVLQVYRLLHWPALRREERVRLHRGRHRRGCHIYHLHCPACLDDMRQVSYFTNLAQSQIPLDLHQRSPDNGECN